MPTRVSRTVQINAPPEKVWGVMTDVERWPEWAESMRKVTREGSGKFGMGSAARIEAMGAPTSVWRVTEYDEGRSFTWETKARGVACVAGHVVEADGNGSKVTLTGTFSGLPATLFAPLVALVGRRNIQMEAEGLKRRCEAV